MVSHLREVITHAVHDPIGLGFFTEPVVLFKCTHRIEKIDAQKLFGELNDEGNVTQQGPCPLCRANVEGYAIDRIIKELASSLGSLNISLLNAQVEVVEDIELHKMSAANGNANSMHYLGEFFMNPNGKTPPDLNQAVVYLQNAARAGHPEAKTRLLNLYIDKKLGSHSRIDPSVLKACIDHYKVIPNETRLILGQWIEQGYGLDQPDYLLALTQYKIAFKFESKEACAHIMRILPQLKHQEETIITLLNKPTLIFANLNKDELVTIIELAKKINADNLPQFITEIISLGTTAPIKLVEIMLQFYKDSWANDYLKSQISSSNQEILRLLGRLYLTDRLAMTFTPEESFNLIEKCNFPHEYVEAHVFLGNCYYSLINYEKAIEELDIAAASNHIESILLLGVIHEKMNNYPLALNKFEKAVELNNAEGLYNRGRYAQLGIVGEINIENAKSDYIKSLRLGSMKALIALVNLLHETQGYTEVVDLLNQYQSFPEAKVLLGICYFNGYSVQQDRDRAQNYFSLSNSDLTHSLISKAYIRANDRTNFEISQRNISADCSDPDTCYIQGQNYEQVDMAISLKYYLKAAENGLWEAKKRIAELVCQRKIPSGIKVPMLMFEAGCELIKPTGSENAIVYRNMTKGQILCSGEGLSEKDVKKGVNILSGVIRKNDDLGAIEVIANLFINTSNSCIDRNEAFKVLKNNKKAYLAQKRALKKCLHF